MSVYLARRGCWLTLLADGARQLRRLNLISAQRSACLSKYQNRRYLRHTRITIPPTKPWIYTPYLGTLDRQGSTDSRLFCTDASQIWTEEGPATWQGVTPTNLTVPQGPSSSRYTWASTESLYPHFGADVSTATRSPTSPCWFETFIVP